MKRKNGKRIVVIILCLLGFLLFLYVRYGITETIVNLHNTYKEIINFIGALIAILGFLGFVARHIYSVYVRKSITNIDFFMGVQGAVAIEPSLRSILEVKNTEELEAVADNRFFMENPAVGKLEKEKRTWRDVKKGIDFSEFPPLKLSSYKYGVFFITGKPGAGKSTYMLWSLDKFLDKKSWWRHAKEKIVFLNPSPEAYTSWAKELAGYDSRKTLLVIDALYRSSDTDEIFRDRCSHLFKLAFGEMKTEDDETIGPFKVLATIREDEYGKLKFLPQISQREFKPTRVYPIIPEKLVFKKILKRLLFYYNVFLCEEELKEFDEEYLRKQSEGLPFYIRLLAMRLAETKEPFSKDTFKKFPQGIANLIWDTISKQYYLKEDIVIPFLLLLFSRTDRYFSSHFLDFVKETLAQEGKKEEIAEKIISLREMYFQSFKDSKGVIIYALSSHWKDSLNIALEQPDRIFSSYKSIVEFYRTISDMQFTRRLEEIVAELLKHLQEGFKDQADDSLCIDLAGLSESGLVYATDMYINFCSSRRFSLDCNEYVREELYELWISNAWKYRAAHNDDKVINCYENAFDRLEGRSHPHQLHAYAFYLHKKVLPKCNHGTQEWKKYKEQIEKLYKEVIEIQSRQCSKEDPVSYLGLASFYKDVGETEKAKEAFEKALQIDPKHVPTKLEYAIFLESKSVGKYKEAEVQLKEAKQILEKEKERSSSKKIKEDDKKVRNAYILFCRDKVKRHEKELSKEEKINGYKKVDDLFDELLKEYSDHGQSITAYSDFLIDDAAVLKKYEGGKNLQKAENLLKDFITSVEDGKAIKDHSYFVALHILALYYYRSDYEWYRGKPLFQEAEDLLKKSSKSFNPIHNFAYAYNELGQLYTEWAKTLKESDARGYSEKIKLAEKAYEEATKVPQNRSSVSHLIKVYSDYAFYFQYICRPQQAEECVQKVLELVDKYSVYEINLYYTLTTLGENFLKDHTLDTSSEIFRQAVKLSVRYEIDPSFAIRNLVEIYQQKGEIEKATESYLQLARFRGTSEDYNTCRHSIKELMSANHILPSHCFYNTCMQACIECSENAYNLDPNSWLNCRNYGEDLAKMKRYKEAVPILEKGIELIEQSIELNEFDKIREVGFFSYLFKKIDRRRDM